jgi:hypothetical protein
MSKGGSTTSSTSIDPDIKRAFLSNIATAQGVATALPVQQFAGYNPFYTAGEQQLINTGLGGPGISSTDYAAQMAALSGTYQPAELQAAQANLGMSGQGSLGSYMNPYTSLVRQNALDDLESSRRMAIQNTGERATAARAFGGSRQGVAEALTNQGFAKQAGTLGTQLNESAFNQAVQLQAADLARQQQAGLANQAMGLQGAQFRLGAANQLGDLGAQQQALRLGGAQAAMGAGGARQAFEQQQLDALRNVDLQRLGISQSALGFNPASLGASTTTPYSRNVGASILGGATAGSQLAGLTGGSVSGEAGAAIGALLGLF